MTADNKRIAIQIRCDEELRDQWNAYCNQRKLNGSDVLRDVIKDFINGRLYLNGSGKVTREE